MPLVRWASSRGMPSGPSSPARRPTATKRTIRGTPDRADKPAGEHSRDEEGSGDEHEAGGLVHSGN